MRWSFRVARVSGIDVRLHASFALTAAYFALGVAATYGLRGALFAGPVLVIGIACLALHELGQVLVARKVGLTVSEIVLLPIGGVTRYAMEPRKPRHEVAIALGGLLVSLVVALALLVTVPHVLGPVLAPPSSYALLRVLFWGNVALAALNAFPGLPLDGGRVLRALLAVRLGRDRATAIAAGFGQALGLGLGFWALREEGPGSWLLAAAGAFSFVGAGRERALVRKAELLADLRAGEVCDPTAMVLAPHEPLGHVLDAMVRTAQSHFAVFHGKELVGTVGRDDVLLLAPRVGLQAPVSAVMRRELFAVDAGAPLDEVQRRLLDLGGHPLVIRAANGYAGVIGFDDVQRIVNVTERLARAGIRRPQPVPDPALH